MTSRIRPALTLAALALLALGLAGCGPCGPYWLNNGPHACQSDQAR